MTGPRHHQRVGLRIDAHVHVWGPETARLDWIEGSRFPERVELTEVTTPDTDVVLVTADAPVDQHRTEARALSRLCGQSGVHGFVGPIDLLGDVPRQVDALVELPGFVGVRHNLQDVLGQMDPRQVVVGLQALAGRNVPFDACVRAHELAALGSLIDQVPRLVVVLDHIGKPPVSDAHALHRWSVDLARLAARPGTFCKLSGLPAECASAEELDRMAGPVLENALTTFGVERCMVGSDRPISQDEDWVGRVLAYVSPEHEELVVGANAAAVYRRFA